RCCGRCMINDELRRGALTVEERAVGLIKITAVRDALELAPSLTTGMAIGADVAAAEPAPVGTTGDGAKVRVGVDRTRAASGQGDQWWRRARTPWDASRPPAHRPLKAVCGSGR